MKTINIAELLKDYPKGMRLYSPIFGYVYLDKIRPYLAVVVRTSNKQKEEFLYDGRYGMNGECMLFPSKENRDWSTFQRPFKVGDIVQYITDDTDKRKIVEIDTLCNKYHTDSYSIRFEVEDDWKLVSNKFDITTLKPFESRVLVRNNKTLPWFPAIWGFCDKSLDKYNYVVEGGNRFNMCIPFDGNKHLLGTTGDCDRRYKTWEE